MIIVDLHLHTTASHGQATVLEMLAAGKKAGLQIMGFSEHSPMPPGYVYPKEFRADLTEVFPKHVAEVTALRATSTAPRVLLGLEMEWLGQASMNFMQQTVNAFSYDYVLGGIHFINGFDFLQDEWNITLEQCFMRYELYWQSVIELASSNLVQSLAHVDIIKIYTIAQYQEWLKLESSLELIERAMQAIKQSGVAMEISSAGLRKPCQEIYPGTVVMTLAAKYKIPITFASDAHCANTPGFAFDVLAAYAKSYGYSNSWYFENKYPRSLEF